MTWLSELSRKGRKNNLNKSVVENRYKVEIGKAGCLGVEKAGNDLIFRIALSTTKPVSLILYKIGTDEIVQEISLEHNRVLGNVYAVKVLQADERKLEYNYRVGNKVILDPYARRINGRKNFGVRVANGDGHQIRCGFYFAEYDWKEDSFPRIPFEDAIMYELHVRGFTKQGASKVRHKGTFKGIMEKADYLRQLGINQVKLMPAYEFDEILKLHAGMHMNYKEELGKEKEKLNYWGYESGSYFAPKLSYAASQDPITEMKDMVHCLHEKGIEVLMEFFFGKEISPRMATECLLYWVTEYHIDGFQIFGNQQLLYLLAREPMLADTKLLGEYFPYEEVYPEGGMPRVRNLGEYNDGFMLDIRRLLKGDEDQLSSFAYRTRKNPSYCGMVNYVTKHDGFTLFDLVSYNEKHNEANGEKNKDGSNENYSWNCGVEGITRKRKIVELRKRQMKNAWLMLLLAAGTPMIRSGDEFANSQDGNNNPYCLDDEISWINWRGEKRNQELTDFVRKVIAFRKRHRILHMEKELAVMDTLSCGYPDLSYHGSRAWYGGFENESRQIGVMYCGRYAQEKNFLYVAYNLHWKEQEFALPHLPENMKWHLAINSETGVCEEGTEQILDNQKIYLAKERTITVLIGRK